MMTKTQKITLAIVTILILILIIVIAAFIGAGQKNPSDSKQVNTDKTGSVDKIKEKQSEEAAAETQKLIDEVREVAKKVGEVDDIVGGSQIVEIQTSGEIDASGTPQTTQGVVVVPGSSIISVETGDVVNQDGEKADNTVTPGDPDAPQSSNYLQDGDELPKSAIKLELSDESFNPSEFTVNAGQVVVLAVTNNSGSGGLFRFEDESLSAVAFSIMAGLSKSITFNAPTTKGEYGFYSDRRSHIAAGLIGKMIVK